MPKGFEAQRWGPAYAPSAVSSSVALSGPTERLRWAHLDSNQDVRRPRPVAADARDAV